MSSANSARPADESTPLVIQIDTHAKPKKKTWFQWHRMDLAILLVLVVAFVVCTCSCFYLYILPDLGDYVSEGTEFETESVSFLGVSSDGGIEVKVTGTGHNNYSRIDDPVVRRYFETGGWALHSLNLKVANVDLMVGTGGNANTTSVFEKVGYLKVMPFTVLTGNHRDSDLDLLVTIYPDTNALFDTVKKMLLDNSKTPWQLAGDAKIQILLLNDYLPITNLKIPLDVMIPKNLVDGPDVALSNFEVVSQFGHSVKCLLEVSMQNPIRHLLEWIGLTHIVVPLAKWNLAVSGCGDEQTEVATLRHDKRVTIAQNDTMLDFSFYLDFDNSKFDLGKRCDDGSKPISKLIDGVVQNGTLNVVLSGDKISDMPGSLSHAFKRFGMPLAIPLDIFSGNSSSSLVEDVTMDDISFELDESAPYISGDLKITLNFGAEAAIGSSLDFKSLRGLANLTYEGSQFGNVDVPRWLPATTTPLNNGTKLLVVCDLERTPMDLTDIPLFQQIVAEVLAGGSAEIGIDALVETKLDSFLGDLEIKDIPGSGTAEFSI